MEGREHTVEDGETIFREGQNSLTVYRIVKGRVRLTKSAGGKGPKSKTPKSKTAGGYGGESVTLAVLEDGEFFGEMGVLDDSPRSATATAEGAAIVEVISREVFFRALQETPGLAFSLMEKLVQRLRHMDDTAAALGIEAGDVTAVKEETEEGWYPPGLISQLFGGKVKRPVGPEMISVQVSSLYGDGGSKNTKLLVRALDNAPGIRAVLFNKRPLLNKHIDLLGQLAGARGQARDWLAESGADLFIWGHVGDNSDLLHLRFVPAVSHEDERPGGFGLASGLDLPTGFSGAAAELLAAIALAVSRPRTAPQQQRINEVLPPTLEMASSVGLNPDIVRGDREKASIRVCFGNACGIAGTASGGTQWYRLAVKAYRLALQTLTRHAAPIEWAVTQRQMGNILVAIGERDKDKDSLEAAVEALENALQVFTLDRFPHDHVSTGCMLGQALIKLERRSGEPRHLKQGVKALRDVLEHLEEGSAPWAEAKHNLGRALQILGARGKDESLFNEAVNACEAALNARLKTKAPLPIATSRNNLGSALFMYAKLAQSPKKAAAAAEQFTKALKTYKTLSLATMAKVAEKNKIRALELLEGLGGK